MKITRKNTGTKVNLIINIDNIELAPIKRHVLGHFKDQVKIPGFRPGTAPTNILEKHVNQSELSDELVNHAINHYYSQALKSENIRAIGQPDIKVKKFVPYAELEFEIDVEALGPITLPDYKKIKVPKKSIKVIAKDIDEVLQRLRTQLAERREVEREAMNNDEVSIDFDGYDDKGKAVSGASAKSYPLVLGSGSFIPGFEEKIVGSKAGQDLEFNVKFPTKYGVASLANQKVDFKVKVVKVSEIIEPKIDDSFAAKAGPFKTMSELKTDIKKQLKVERDAQSAREYENEIVKAITSQSRLVVPKSLIDEEVLRMEEDEKNDLLHRGKTWQEHLKEESITEEEHRERQRPNASERVKSGLVLSEIAEREKIQVSDDEVSKRIDLMKEQYQDPQMRAELDDPKNRNNIVSRILTEKTLSVLVNYSSKS